MNDKVVNVPKCVGFIMDGNRRFAAELSKKSLVGHKDGGDTFLRSVQWVKEAQIPHAVYYAFSTENWNRNETEIHYLMDLFRQQLKQMDSKSGEEKIRFCFIGRLTDFAQDIQKAVKALEDKTASYTKTTIWVALSYGGRAEIVEAVNKAIENGAPVTEESFSKLLYTAEMPDPDLIIRTGGESRLSNFLPWQSTYSELFFTKTLWPAFTKDEFQRILNDYAARERRIGK
jgi:undecaprenyl diphosphate synthase